AREGRMGESFLELVRGDGVEFDAVQSPLAAHHHFAQGLLLRMEEVEGPHQESWTGPGECVAHGLRVASDNSILSVWAVSRQRRCQSEISNHEIERLLGMGAVWITLAQFPKSSKFEDVVDATLQVLAGRHERIHVQRGQPVALGPTLRFLLL